MLIQYIGLKAVKYDNVNDPQTPYIWSEENNYIVDVKEEHCARLLKHEEVWRKYEVQLEANAKTDVKTDIETVEERKGK